MAWHIAGRTMELCSCKMFCPCWLGPEGEPDQGWCSSVLAYEVQQGQSDGVDLSGTKAVLALDWPGNFFAGGGTGRLYVDETASAGQRRELEAIFTGHKGGLLETLWGAVLDDWRPSQVTRIDLAWGDRPTATVGSVGRATLAPLQDQAGRPTKIEGAAAQAAFQIESMTLASSRGSSWSDPEMRAWQGDSGSLSTFDWQG